MLSQGTHFEPDAPLNESIRHFYCIQTPSDSAAKIQHLAPGLEMMLIFNFGKPVRISFSDEMFGKEQVGRVAAIGPLRRMMNYEVLPGTDLIVTVFNPNGFYRLFQLPMDQFEDKLIDPDKVLGISGFSLLWENLKNLPSLHERIQLLKDYASVFITESDHAATPLTEGIHYFHNPLTQPVRAIAYDSDLSERTIQLRFKKYLGYSPKELLRFIRFKRVINHIQSQENEKIDWHSLLEQFGYHDQSHLIKDFRLYLGTSPQKFIRDIAGKQFCVVKPGESEMQ